MRIIRTMLLAGLVLIAPLLASGVLEMAGLGRVRSRECYFSKFKVDLLREADTYAATADTMNPGIVGTVWFDPMTTEFSDSRPFFGTRFHRFRNLSILTYTAPEGRMTDEREIAKVRTACRDFMIENGYPAQLAREIEMPNYSRSGINWPGVYFNGVIVLILLAIPIALLAVPVYFISPAGRRKRRAARGHCPECDYDLRANADEGCPECGWRRSP